MGDKWGDSGASRAYWETSGRQIGDKYKIMRPAHSEHPELSGRQVGDKWETSIKSCGQRTQSIQSFLGDKWETNGASGPYWETSGRQGCNHAARNTSPETDSKSSGPSMHPFKRSKNPSQVNLFGEKCMWKVQLFCFSHSAAGLLFSDPRGNQHIVLNPHGDLSMHGEVCTLFFGFTCK